MILYLRGGCHINSKKCDQMIAKANSKYCERKHKYGIRAPQSTREAQEIDPNNGNTIWIDTVYLETKNAEWPLKSTKEMLVIWMVTKK